VAAKQLLCEATCLVHLELDAELSLVVDTSDAHIGAVLQQSSLRRGPMAPGLLLQEVGSGAVPSFNY
jgi:hypothetical protein